MIIQIILEMIFVETEVAKLEEVKNSLKEKILKIKILLGATDDKICNYF